MASKKISVILSLKDKFSPGIKEVSKNTDKATRDMKKARRSVFNFVDGSANKINALTNKFIKFGAAAGTAVAGLAIKKGLSEAMDLEGYKTQLVTATKSTRKASKIMKYAVELANKTPFEGGEMVEGAAKFEAMGMSARKWLTYAGDMAGATNKSFDQSVEALIDAQTGELERLKEFGITKAMITERAEKMFRGVTVVNNKGQIEDQKKFNEAMLALMKDKFTGGMVAQSKTLKGTISTITGITKSGLAQIMGMSSSGEIKKGSVFDILRKKGQELANQFVKWQKDGTIEKIANKATEAVQKGIKKAQELWKWVQKHKAVITKIGIIAAKIALVTAAAARLWAIGRKIYIGIQAVRTACNILKVAGLGPVTIAIMAAIAAGVLIYKNWDKIKAAAERLRNKCKASFEDIKNKFKTAGDNIRQGWESIKKKAIGAKDAVIKFFKGIGKAVIDTVKKPFKWIGDKIDKLKKGVSNVVNAGSDLHQPTRLPGNANGTSYWRGGLTQINEHGPEVVDLPTGTRIIPANRSKNMSKPGVNLTVNVTVQGNLIGNEEYANEMAEKTSQKIIEALGNA